MQNIGLPPKWQHNAPFVQDAPLEHLTVDTISHIKHQFQRNSRRICSIDSLQALRCPVSYCRSLFCKKKISGFIRRLSRYPLPADKIHPTDLSCIRAATIITREDGCQFLRVDKDDFNRILRDVEANTVRLKEHGRDVLVLEKVSANSSARHSHYKYSTFLCYFRRLVGLIGGNIRRLQVHRHGRNAAEDAGAFAGDALGCQAFEHAR